MAKTNQSSYETDGAVLAIAACTAAALAVFIMGFVIPNFFTAETIKENILMMAYLSCGASAGIHMAAWQLLGIWVESQTNSPR